MLSIKLKKKKWEKTLSTKKNKNAIENEFTSSFNVTEHFATYLIFGVRVLSKSLNFLFICSPPK